MSHTVSLRRVALGIAVLLAYLLGWPVAGEAQLGGVVDTTTSTLSDTTSTLTDTTSGTTSTLTDTTSSTTSTLTDTTSTLTDTTTGTLLGTTTVLTGTGTLVGGTSDALQASELAGGVPSLLTGEVLHAVTIGWPDQVASEASLAALALSIAGVNIGADFVMARALGVFGATGVGISNIDNLSINGAPTAVTGDPNQTIYVPGGLLIINEQRTLPDGTVVVNALHAVIDGLADVVVASATAGASGGEAKAVQATTF